MKCSWIPACLWFVCLLTAHTSAGRKIVVPKDNPSVQKALDTAEEGDTVFVLNGTYRGNITLKEQVILMGQSREKTILQGRGTGPVVRGVAYATIKNVTVERGHTGIICENTNTLIEHTIIRNNHTGIHCLISLPVIRNNVIYRNKWTGVFCELITHAMNTAVEHNVIAENGYSGLVLARKSVVLVQNNVFFGNKQYGIFVDMESKRSRIIFNNFFGNRLPFNNYATVDRTNLTRDPQFQMISRGLYDYLQDTPASLKGQGKDGADIGLMSDSRRTRIKIDSDNDRISDDEDKCPDLREDFDEYEDGDGCPDYDNDLDGIYDKEDKCPHKAEDGDNYEDQDGCPDPDNDKDGICDPWVADQNREFRYNKICSGRDQCPDIAETVNGYLDDDGCPDEKPADTPAAADSVSSEK